MRWFTLAISVPEDRIYANEARKILAANAPDNFPQELLHYGSDGVPVKGLAKVRFGSKKSTILIHAIGGAASALLRAESLNVLTLYEKHYGRDLDMQTSGGVFEKTTKTKMMRYRIPALILQQDPAQYKRIKDDLDNPDCPAATELAAQKIRDGLVRQFEDIGFYLEDHEFSVSGVTIKGNESGKFVPIEIKPGVFGLCAKNVEFRSNLSLNGPWHVGHLTSRGYGLILAGKAHADRLANREPA